MPVLGSVLPVSFVAKAEVAGWPVVRHARPPAAHDLHRPDAAEPDRRGDRSDRPARRRTATSWCSSPRGPPATATASCPSGARSSARPSAVAGRPSPRVQPVADFLHRRRTGFRSAARDRPEHRLVWRHGPRSRISSALARARRDRRGGELRRADPLRARSRTARRSPINASPPCAQACRYGATDRRH